MLHVAIYLALLAIAAGYSAVRGGAPERIAAAACVLATMLTFFARSPTHTRYAGVEVGILIVDASLFLVLTILAVTANRFWPIWIAAFQVVALISHGLRLVDVEVNNRAYKFALAIMSDITLIVIILAVARHRLRVKRIGADPPWKPSFKRAAPDSLRSGPTP